MKRDAGTRPSYPHWWMSGKQEHDNHEQLRSGAGAGWLLKAVDDPWRCPRLSSRSVKRGKVKTKRLRKKNPDRTSPGQGSKEMNWKESQEAVGLEGLFVVVVVV